MQASEFTDRMPFIYLSVIQSCNIFLYSIRPFNEHQSRNTVFLLGSKKLLSQPFSYRLIIQFQTQASQNDTQNKNTHSYIPSFSQCIKFILNQPCVEQIHQRIMYYINRIGYISQELAYLCRLLIRSSTRRPQPHKKGKTTITQKAS